MYTMKGKRVLVTGATGFIGYQLCKKLLKSGVEVYALSRRPPSIEKIPNAKIISTNLKNHEKTYATIYSIKPDIVYHLAGLVDSTKILPMVLDTLQNNLVTTVNLFLSLAELGCKRVIVAGTSEASSAINGAAPNSPYSASKEAVAQYSQMFHHVFQLPVTIARIFSGYGPRQSENKLIPQIIVNLLRNSSPQINHGKRVLDFIHVNDIVTGLIKMGTVEGLDGKTIDLGTGIGTQISDVVNTIANIINVSVDIDFSSSEQFSSTDILADTTRTTRLLGFQPKWSLRRGLDMTVQWYRKDAFRKYLEIKE